MAERTPLMAGNWKMHKTGAEAVALAQAVGRASPSQGVEVMVAPPFTALSLVSQAIKDLPLKLGAQNLYPAGEGAFTGEISPKMLADLGVDYVILGHSERRQILGEEDGFIRQKVEAALAQGLRPILCCGETLDQRQAGQTEVVIEGQLEKGLAGLELEDGQDLVVAYEPIWAIGTGQTASPDQAQEVQGHIRSWLVARFNKEVAKAIRILYGGSVKGDNVKALMAQVDIDGALVGGASLTPEAFLPIVGFEL
ncbi:MAG: triose-phosphate isomerase [Deltaproteobacteria bacterium]|nr:triose-phosphate isomerase [Deltaproteobacteria bacterium]